MTNRTVGLLLCSVLFLLGMPFVASAAESKNAKTSKTGGPQAISDQAAAGNLTSFTPKAKGSGNTAKNKTDTIPNGKQTNPKFPVGSSIGTTRK